MRRLLATIFCLAFLSSLRAQTNSLPPHPRLLLNADGIAQLKTRIATEPWAKASWQELKARVDRTLDEPVALPPRGGNWGHNYVCPIHGARLRQGKKIGNWQWEHICPIGDHVLHGDPSQATLDFDGNIIMNQHEDLARQALDDGLVFQVTGDARYAQKAREILLAYAARYLSYPLHNNWGKMVRGGRVSSQALTEATWLIDLTQGADLVWDTLGADDRRAISEKILLPALNEIIIPQPTGIHNIQCRENSAIGLVGFLLGDQKLIAEAIDDPKLGFHQQMDKGVLDDGMWLEGSTGYHFYTIDGLWPLMEAARNCGIDLYGPKFKKMFDGPFALAMPDLALPNFNDSGISPLRNRADLYELAFARFHDPAYAVMLDGGDRRGRMALFFGAAQLPAATSLRLASRNLTASGYAILDRGQDTNATWLCTKYGPHGGGHGHPDKNTFIVYARGRVLAPDAGTHAYGSPLHAGWDKTTVAHNTLVVDEKSQSPATGQCLAFGADRGVDFSVTDAGPIYPGVHFTRTAALLTTNLIVFVDQIKSDAPHTFDIVCHQIGVWENPLAGEHWKTPGVPGYKYLIHTTTRMTAGAMTLKTKVSPNWQPAIVLAGGEPTEVITGDGILSTTEDHVPVLLQRRHAEQTVFVWAMSLDGAPVKLQAEDVADVRNQNLDRATALLVRVNCGPRQWSLLANPERKDISARRPDGSAWRSQAAFAVAD